MTHDMMTERPSNITIDPALCALCGRENGCAMAADPTSSTPCWCTPLAIPRSLLALVPEEARNRACICRACIERHREDIADRGS
jgi:hypothetical protein